MPHGSQKFRLVLLAAACGWAFAACGSSAARPPANGGAAGRAPIGGMGGMAEAQQTFAIIPTHNQLDLVFVVDDAGDAVPQNKLVRQIPQFIAQLSELPNGFPDLHVAVVTADMGAPSNAPITCSAAGDVGAFQTTPHWTCANTPLQGGATFLAQNGASRNFVGDLETAVQCLLPATGDSCGFIQPLAALARALGADGAPPPAGNAGFLRPNALLGIILLANQDDCSTPAGTQLYSLAGSQSSLADPLGPLNTYRCNRYGHLCADAAGNPVMPPLTAPPDGGTEQLADCKENTTSSELLIPVDQLVADIKSLKADPDHQIIVSAIVASPMPYGIGWQAAGVVNPQNPGELWPRVLHSCGPPGGAGVNPTTIDTTFDGSFGDPAVRISRFASEFLEGSVNSLCAGNYALFMSSVLLPLGTPAPPNCIDPTALTDANGQPTCKVVRHVVMGSSDQQTPLPNCDSSPIYTCWQAEPGSADCPTGAFAFQVEDQTYDGATGVYYAVSCPLR